QRDHYKTLGVKSTATKKELKAQFYKLSKKYHPDKNPGDSEAHSKFVEINDSYTVLSDVAQRRQHDQYLRSQTPSSSSSPHHPQQRPPRPKNYTTRDPLRPEDWILYRRRNMNNSTTSSPGFDHESHQNEHYGAAADAAEKREQSRQSRLFKTLYYQKLQEAQRIEQKMMMTAAVFGLSIFFIFHSGLIQMIWMDDD
ncbi:DnaJ domain-containing protein, partial [Powellomyces hirtus]